MNLASSSTPTSSDRCGIYTYRPAIEGLDQDLTDIDALQISAEANFLSRKQGACTGPHSLHDDGIFTGVNSKRARPGRTSHERGVPPERLGRSAPLIREAHRLSVLGTRPPVFAHRV